MDRYVYDVERDLKVYGCNADYLTFGQGSVKYGHITLLCEFTIPTVSALCFGVNFVVC
jgi:hypothetical protein